MVAKLSQFSLLDLIFDGVAICDEHKKVIYCNPGLAMMAQVGPGRLCRGKLYDFFLFKDPSFCLMPEGRLTQAPMINQELQFKD
ncbi:MAG: PAS domain-containing protein, partial [Bdellovibrionota bacterium]